MSRFNTDLRVMADVIMRNAENKRDYLADTAKLKVTEAGKMLVPVNGNGAAEPYGMTEHTHGQIAAKLEIPKRYYDRLKATHPDLWASNVNTLFERENEKRMIRTLDGHVRAYLSDRFRRIDNEEVAEVLLPALMKFQGLVIHDCEVTERKMYINAFYPAVTKEITGGDYWSPGVQIGNSEIGAGSLYIQFYAWRQVCRNGMIGKDYRFGKYHTGRRTETGEDVAELFYSERTQKLDDAAFLSKTLDVLNGAMSDNGFNDMVLRLQKATLDVIPTAQVEQTVELIATNYQLKDNERRHALMNLIKEGNLSRYGLANGITNAANSVDEGGITEDYDRAQDLREIGGKIIDLTAAQWRDVTVKASVAHVE